MARKVTCPCPHQPFSSRRGCAHWLSASRSSPDFFPEAQKNSTGWDISILCARFASCHLLSDDAGKTWTQVLELGRQSYKSRKFFDKYQDRILFATAATPHGDEFPQQVFSDKLYEIYYRFLETEDEYFDYAPARIPPQGRWRIYGINLSAMILRKVYRDNAAWLLRV